jgi:hypothetical protein
MNFTSKVFFLSLLDNFTPTYPTTKQEAAILISLSMA